MTAPRLAAGVAALALSGLGVLGLQSSASAGTTAVRSTVLSDKKECPPDYPPKPKHERQDGDVEAKGQGYKPCSDANEYVESTPTFVGTVQADINGNVDAFITLPAGLADGTHHVVLRGLAPNGAPLVESTPVTVKNGVAVRPGTAPGSVTPGTGTGTGTGTGLQLPHTGAEIAGVTGLGVVLLASGGAAVYAGRRRRFAAELTG